MFYLEYLYLKFWACNNSKHIKIPFSKGSSLLSKLTQSLLRVPFPDLWAIPLKRPKWDQGMSLIGCVDGAWTSGLYSSPVNCKRQTRVCPLLLTPPAQKQNVVDRESWAVPHPATPHPLHKVVRNTGFKWKIRRKKKRRFQEPRERPACSSFILSPGRRALPNCW